MTARVTLDRSFGLLLRDVGLDIELVAREASLDPAILSMERCQLTVEAYFRLVHVIERVSGDPALVLNISPATFPTFSPVLFACLCSPNLGVAVERLAAHKRLIAPMQVRAHQTPQGLTVSWHWEDPTLTSPRLLAALELVLMTQIARIGTRTQVTPLRVTSPTPLIPADRYAAFFGATVRVGSEQSITFSAVDARRPFLTENSLLWRSFEPELRRLHFAMHGAAPLVERTRAILLECLPSGQTSLPAAARRLGISGRTLQRRLGEQGTSFRCLVRETRQRLAKHYLHTTTLPCAEVAFLLGFDEVSSFYRAYRTWTGQTPEATRRRHQEHQARPEGAR